jgi:hypothetical protein
MIFLLVKGKEALRRSVIFANSKKGKICKLVAFFLLIGILFLLEMVEN